MLKRKFTKEQEDIGIEKPEVFIAEPLNTSFNSKYFVVEKKRNHDFQENEIDVDSHIIDFTSEDELQSADEKDDPLMTETVNEDTDIAEMPVTELNYPLNSEEKWRLLSLLLKRNNKDEFVRINVTNVDKTERTLIHKSVEERYNGRLTTNTVTEDQQKYIVIGTNKSVDHDRTIIEIVSQPDFVEPDSTRIFRWGDNPAKLFFDLFRQKSQDLKTEKIKTQKKMFEAIAQGMIEKGYDVTLTIVQNRYKWCRKKYFQLKKNVGLRVSKYLEDALEEMFGSGRSHPVGRVSSSRGLKMNASFLNFREKSGMEEEETYPLYMDLSEEETEIAVNNISPSCRKKAKAAESPKILLTVAESLSSFISESIKFQKLRDKTDHHLLMLYKKEIDSRNKFHQELLEILRRKKS